MDSTHGVRTMGDCVGTFSDVYNAMREDFSRFNLTFFVFENYVDSTNVPLESYIGQGLPEFDTTESGYIVWFRDANLKRSRHLWCDYQNWEWDLSRNTLRRRDPFENAVSPHPKEMMAGVAQ